MSEKLTFHFEGALADGHNMNFYESARFQYAAARLLAKLSQFRNTGRFQRNISSKSNPDIRLASQSDGSFNINVEDAGKDASESSFLDVTLGDLVAYVSERVIEKLGEEALQGNEETDGVTGRQSTIDQIVESVLSSTTKLIDLPSNNRDLIRRRAAEISRATRLNEKTDAIAKIDIEQSERLIAMSAPLVREMATALRRSANTLEVSSSVSGKPKPVLFLDQDMASEIITSVVDNEITAILCDVIQFNKDNGWGKVKIENGALTVSFSIPYDILPKIKQMLIDTMKQDQVYLQTYFVRDRAGDVIRLIIAGILPTPLI